MANPDSITAYLTSKNLPPTDEWLASFLPSVKSTTPAQATHQTAFWRVRAADLTQSVKPSLTNTFPPNINDGNIQELRLPGPITAQILDIEDVGRSRWSQVEALEAQERGETTRGREVIRVVPEEGNEAAETNARPSSGPHKVLLQDAKGTKVYGIEIVSVGVGVGMTAIGAKLVVRNVVVARGVVLLEPGSVEHLGGKVEAWDVKWREERKKVLKEKAGWRETA